MCGRGIFFTCDIADELQQFAVLIVTVRLELWHSCPVVSPCVEVRSGVVAVAEQTVGKRREGYKPIPNSSNTGNKASFQRAIIE